MKKIIEGAWVQYHLDNTKLARALLQYRNTPSRRDGLSPAQKLFGKPMQDIIPAFHRAFAPQRQQTIQEDDQSQKVEAFYTQHAQPLRELNNGTNVAIQNPITKRWDIYEIITVVGHPTVES